jgi:hypothetical protein
VSLTPEALRERMWGEFPALRMILESKSIPDHHYGYSSVSDNTFEQMQRLLKISILVRENTAAITEALRAEGIHRKQLLVDLHHLREAFRWAGTMFHNAAKVIDNVDLN